MSMMSCYDPLNVNMIPEPDPAIVVPKSLVRLSKQWPTLVGRVHGLTDDLENMFRFGHNVDYDPYLQRYTLGGSAKGGDTIMRSPVTEEAYLTYLSWKSIECISPVGSDSESAASFRSLEEFLIEEGVELKKKEGLSISVRLGSAARFSEGLLRLLPRSFFGQNVLKSIFLGSSRHGAALGSAYEDGKVMIYSFLLRTAKKTFAGLFMHELGHAFQDILKSGGNGDMKTISEAHKIISHHNSFYGTSFWGDRQSRKQYQQNYSEFIPEMFMVYVTQGDALRRHINHKEDPELREAYAAVYRIFKNKLGVEYSRERN